MNAAIDIIPETLAPADDWRLEGFWANPDYRAIWVKRLQRKARMRSDPTYLQALRLYYPTHIADFIQDWGVTVDPRNAKMYEPGTPKKPILMPFVLFNRQREMIDWMLQRWKLSEGGDGDGILVKSRDCGASWLAMATAISLCLFYSDISIGFGSAIKDKVDNAGDPDSLFYKGRMFLRYLPYEFKGLWEEGKPKYSADMRMLFPDTGASITGECGDKIGRGGRKAIYVTDEGAFVEHPKVVDGNLSANTNCRIELSTVNGLANSFAERARGGLIDRFDFDYHDDPRKCYKDEKGVIRLRPWFAKKKAKTDPVVWAQEYERDFLASSEGIIIEQAWVDAAIDAHLKLGIDVTGARYGSYDIADQGKDKCCYASGKGILLDFIQSWKGKGSDTYKSTERAMRLADECHDEHFLYDSDGMGAGVRGDANKINEEREEKRKKDGETRWNRFLPAQAFRGSAAVMDPDLPVPGTDGDRINKDFFENYKAQCWWSLRCKFRATFHAVTGVVTDWNPDDLISISSKLPELAITKSELSQPVWLRSKTGKMMVDKTPDDVASPNNGDAVMMRFGYSRPPLEFPDELLAQL